LAAQCLTVVGRSRRAFEQLRVATGRRRSLVRAVRIGWRLV